MRPLRQIIGLLVLSALLGVPFRTSQAVVLWTENAENGYGNVIDNTDVGYPLIQSDIAGQGTNAFHLANPGFQDNSFVINQTLAIQADTKLFFLSRLGWATSQQVAKVQISTNGGASWPTTIYSQAGNGGSGEGGFGLKQISLASYANQNLRFRFLYDFTGGSAYTQVDSGVGWYVDDIQIADQLVKSQYSIGDPTPHEQQYLEYINRSRADALVEANRLAGETDPDIQSNYSFFGVQPANIVGQFQYSVINGIIDQHAQPLSFNSKLNTAAKLHTQDMFNNQFQGHSSSSNPPSPLVPSGSLGDRLNAVGYSGAAGENVYSYADSVRQGHAGFDVDWGNVTNSGDPNYVPAFAGQGMQNPAGHRINLHNGDFKEIGIGVINGTNGSVGPQLVTQDLGDPGDIAFVTGVVYQDLNGNSFYDIGEGRSGVRVDVEDSAFFAISSTSGGYSIPVGGNGVLDVIFSGGGFSTFMTTATIAGGLNFKVDYLVSALHAGDFDSDGDVDGADFVAWQTNFPKASGSTRAQGDADADGDVDGADFVVWQTNFPFTPGPGAAPVPEPAAWMLAMVALGGVALHTRRYGVAS